ncbi:MAG: hypothetical protein KBB91_02350 [Candidatus Pacebacteria bacterium]|nr:hypothetical protein [Candidatus Paceibacterota bacterium]MBP9701228.1 hypothetical protein [Candidatus Paceibacterota bacterium]
MKILIIVFILYYLSGYLPGRPIKRKKNRWHPWGAFGQIWGWIDGDKKSLLPDSLPWPFRKQYFNFTYNQYVEKGEGIERHETKSDDGKKILYHAATVIPGIKKPVRTVVETLTRIRKTEIHPYVISPVTPRSGFTFHLCFTAKIKVMEPMDTTKLDDFLVFFGNELNDAVFPWAKKFEEKCWGKETDRDKAVNKIIDCMIGLRIDVDKSIVIDRLPLKAYMQKKIDEYGLVLSEFSLDVGYDKAVEEILLARASQTKQAEKTKLQEKLNETRKKEREMEFDDETQEILLDQNRFNNVQKPTIDALKEMQKEANGAWKEGVTLFQGDNDATKQTSALLAGVFNNTKKTGGKNVTQQSNP